jgi:hypothetical protein
MKTKEFLKEHGACTSGARWALSVSEDMADVWEALIEQGKHGWLVWTATRPEVFSDSILRKLACRFIRETPLSDGRKVWDLLTDERSRKAVEVAELYANGKATAQELEAVRVAACAAWAAGLDSVWLTAGSADATVRAATRATARAAFAAAYDDAARAARNAACDVGDAAYAATAAAAYAARAAADDDARAAARDATHVVAYAAYDAAQAAQVQMIAELGNPFK